MFRPLLKKKQLMDAVENEKVLLRNSHGVLGLCGEDGYPYTVPLNYVYDRGKIYFHCAKVGYKLECLLKNPKISFTVVDQDVIVSEEFTSLFRSVIAFGEAAIVEDDRERTDAFLALCEKYSGDLPKEMREQEVARCKSAYIVGIQLHHITGKEAMALAKQRGGMKNA